MKTLSEAVQLQIIDQAGATYRNVVLSYLNSVNNGIYKDDPNKAIGNARAITEQFVEMIEKQLSKD